MRFTTLEGEVGRIKPKLFPADKPTNVVDLGCLTSHDSLAKEEFTQPIAKAEQLLKTSYIYGAVGVNRIFFAYFYHNELVFLLSRLDLCRFL